MIDYKKIAVIVLIVCVAIGIIFLAVNGIQKATFKQENPVATIIVDGYGALDIELYPNLAPNTVANFVKLANNGYYDGTTFHRIVKTFMIQGGDGTNYDGTGVPSLTDLDSSLESKEYAIKGEFAANDFSKNNLKLRKGVLAMARGDYSSLSASLTTEGYNSAGAQFFIMTTDDIKTLDGIYCGFGQISAEYDVNTIVKDEEGIEEGKYTVFEKDGKYGVKDFNNNIVIEATFDKIVITNKYTKDDDGNKKLSQILINTLTKTECILDKIANTEVQPTTDGSDPSIPVTEPVISYVRVDTKGVDYGMPKTMDTFDYYNYLMSSYTSGYSY